LAEWCAELLDEPAVDVISARAAKYATEEVWRALVEQHQRPGGCADLAQAARALLDMRKKIRAYATGAMPGAHPFAEAFVVEVLSRLVMLPFEAQLAAAARGLQIAGICVCVLRGELADCACLKDVLKVEGEGKVEALGAGAMEDWRELPDRMRDISGQ
jgi:hypothetical protein